MKKQASTLKKRERIGWNPPQKRFSHALLTAQESPFCFPFDTRSPFFPFICPETGDRHVGREQPGNLFTDGARPVTGPRTAWEPRPRAWPARSCPERGRRSGLIEENRTGLSFRTPSVPATVAARRSFGKEPVVDVKPVDGGDGDVRGHARPA